MNAGSWADEYISRLPDWQQAVCQQVRQLAHDADPEVEETIKRSVLPYYTVPVPRSPRRPSRRDPWPRSRSTGFCQHREPGRPQPSDQSSKHAHTTPRSDHSNTRPQPARSIT
jgi:hypothetical protein